MAVITRAEWGANPRSLPAATMRLPATEVYIHHSVTATSDYPIADMRAIERIGLTRFNQFSYSYVVHPKGGELFEGCGLRRGAHTAQRNSTSFGICWAGNYEERLPKIQQVDATRWLIAELKRQGHLVADAPIRGHRDVFATACPGSKLYALLDAIRAPYAPPAPAPAPSPATPSLELDVNLKAIALSVNLDGNGKGWTTIPYPIERVVGHLAHSGTRPAADGRYDGTPDTVGFTPQGAETVVVVQGGNPGGTAPVWLQVLED